MATVSVVLAKDAFVWGDEQAGPRAALVTDGQRLWVVSHGRYGQSLAERAWELFRPGDPAEALTAVCERAVSSYTTVTAPVTSELPAQAVAEQLAADLGMTAVPLPAPAVTRAAG